LPYLFSYLLNVSNVFLIMYIHYKEVSNIQMIKEWLRQSLKNQLILFISMSVIIPVIIFGVISYSSAVKVSKDRANISGKSSITQLQTSLEFIVNDVLSMSVFLIGNRDVQDYMENNDSTPRQRSNITGFLANLAYTKEYISNITLYPSGDNPDLSTNPKHKEGEMNFKKDENKWWTYPAKEETVSGLQETITLVRPVRSLSGLREIGHLSISLNREYLKELLQATELEWNGTVLLFKNDFLLASSTATDFEEPIFVNTEYASDDQSFTENINGKKYTIFKTDINEVNWSLVGIIPYKEFSFQNRYLLWITVIMIVVAIILIILLLSFVISKVLDPLFILTNSIRRTKPGEPISILPFTEKNEIGNLIDNYNQLNERIVYLMNQIKYNESMKRQVDLQALQHQINPHFLYNTLASIHWMALRTNQQNISTMVSALSTYLRYSLNEGNEYTTIAQEIDLLKHYTNIQHIRFPNMFQVHVNIPTSIQHYKMLKLVIQPLIENSILHGRSTNKQEKIDIYIEANIMDHHIHFTISDNGVGMTKEQIQTLHKQFFIDHEEGIVVGSSYGLRNVNL